MGQILAFVNIVLTLLDKFVAWGQRAKVFKEDEAIIALEILRKAQRDIETANNVKAKVDSAVVANPDNPDSVLNDEFTRK